MNFADFGMDTASLAGTLESKLAAIRAAGFAQVMISAADVVAHPSGVDAGARCVRESGLRVTGLESLCDFEGLDGQLHAYKVDVAKSMLDVCRRIGSNLLLVEATTSTHADPDAERTVRDLRKLAMLAIPLGVESRTRRAPEAARRPISPPHATSCSVPRRRAWASRSTCSTRWSLPRRARKSTRSIRGDVPVQLSDFMWNEFRSVSEHDATATHFRVFPGEGAHSDALADLVRQIDNSAISATTASTSTTTTISSFPRKPSPIARAAPPTGWARPSSAARCRCRTSSECAARSDVRRDARAGKMGRAPGQPSIGPNARTSRGVPMTLRAVAEFSSQPFEGAPT